MANQLIENILPNLKENGLNSNVTATLSTATVTTLTATTATMTTGTATTLTVSGVLTATGAQVPTGGIGAAGGFAISPRLMATGGMPARVSTDGTDATPVTTETYIAEVFVPANVTLTGVAVMNGSATGTGNICVALANSSGAIVANSTSTGTALAGTDTYQQIPFSTTYSAVGPATYYVLSQYNSTNTRYNTHVFGAFGAAKKTGETFGTFTTITPATTFTTALGNIASLY